MATTIRALGKFRLGPFEGTFNALVGMLNGIKSEAPKGKPAPTGSPGTTDTGAKAYGDAYGKAKAELKKVVDGLTPQQLDFFSGLNFTDPNDEAKKRTDILNSVLSAWDMSASKYMKNAQGDGDAGVPKLKARLQEFDTAIISQGKTPVKPDQ